MLLQNILSNSTRGSALFYDGFYLHQWAHAQFAVLNTNQQHYTMAIAL